MLFLMLRAAGAAWVLVAALFVVNWSCMKRAASAADKADAQAVGRYLIDGMTTERLKLHRGIYRCVGKWKMDSAGGATIRSFRIYSAFDDEAGLYRFDRAQDFSILSNEPMTIDEYKRRARDAREASEPGILCLMDIRYFRTPTKSAVWQWLKGSEFAASGVNIRAGDSKEIPGFLDTFDVRGIGLYTWFYLMDDVVLATVLEPLRQGSIDDVVEVGSSEKRVTIISENKQRRTVIWIDENRGFTPSRLEDHYLDKGGNWLPPDYINETKWELRSGIWVPGECAVVNKVHAKGDRAYGEWEDRWDMVFNWEDVGSPLRDELFSARGLDPPKGTLVIDFRSDPPILEEVIGEPSLVAKRASPPARRPLLLLAIINGVVVLFFILGIYMNRRRQKR